MRKLASDVVWDTLVAQSAPRLKRGHCRLARTCALLIELEMPDTDGRALATEGRQGDSPNAGSMLILISAADNQTAGQAWPFDGCLQKPIDGEALARLFGSQPGRWAMGAGRWALAAGRCDRS